MSRTPTHPDASPHSPGDSNKQSGAIVPTEGHTDFDGETEARDKTKAAVQRTTRECKRSWGIPTNGLRATSLHIPGHVVPNVALPGRAFPISRLPLQSVRVLFAPPLIVLLNALSSVPAAPRFRLLALLGL